MNRPKDTAPESKTMHQTSGMRSSSPKLNRTSLQEDSPPHEEERQAATVPVELAPTADAFASSGLL